MTKKAWVVVCLIALEGVFCCSEWKISVRLLDIHRDALALHEQAERALREGGSAATARPLDERGWALVEEGQELRKAKLLWQLLAVAGMAALLGTGVWSLRDSRREKGRLSRDEAELRKARASLEQQIEARTQELRREVDERRRAEERNRRQKRVLELLANDAPLAEIFSELTASVAGERRAWEAAVHLVDPQRRALQLVGSSQVSDRLEHYLRSIVVDFPDAPESAAWAGGEAKMIASMVEQHRPWSEFLASNGIRSACSLPLLLSDGTSAGTLTVYGRLFGVPDEQDRELLDAAVRLATLVVDVRRMNRELQRKAYEDELTGVANRRAGEIRLQEAMDRARVCGASFAVLWIDLDRFKRVNDLYGHTHGDQVLLETAKRIAAHPHVNGSVARMGGDEFLVLLESCADEATAQATAGELAAGIVEPMQLGDETATVGASIGITMFPRDGETPGDLERHADAAMYQAKRKRLGWCTFSPAIRSEEDRALSIEEGLRAAVASEDDANGLEVYYQPILGRGGEILGCEGLLRFRHPELGLVSPSDFIPIAEETRLILPVGRWVLREVCRQIVTWQAEGLSARAGVNISAVQWGREDFVDEVRSAMEEYGVDGRMLTLELTESVVIQNADRARAHMRRLKAMGVRVAMDDFGTGYSSLSYLHQLPLDVLKIDRSFVARMGQTDDSRTIVESVISMAHLLGMVAVAEGVETETQRTMLAAMGCDAMQGYLFARPMPANETGDFLRDLLSRSHEGLLLAAAGAGFGGGELVGVAGDWS